MYLNGEAEFKVIHKPDNQNFTVETPDHTLIQVLGTVFVVNARRNATRVVLETGRIQLSTPRQATPLLLLPGDVVTVAAQGPLKRQRPAVVPSRVTWHDHRFVFTDTPLLEVAGQLHDTFGVTVQVPQPQLLSRTVSGTFQAETADDLIEALSLMMDLQVEKSSSVYVLTQQ